MINGSVYIPTLQSSLPTDHGQCTFPNFASIRPTAILFWGYLFCSSKSDETVHLIETSKGKKWYNGDGHTS